MTYKMAFFEFNKSYKMKRNFFKINANKMFLAS